MWIAVVCGLIIYWLFKQLFYDDDVLEIETSDSSAIFSVADKLEKLHGGKAYVGLRIPDVDSGSRQSIDLVLVTKGEAAVISVKNLSGFVSVNADGSWTCVDYSDHKTHDYADPVQETKKWASILESYLEQREVSIPEGYLSCKVILPNPKFRTFQSSDFPSDVITYDRWAQLKPGLKGMFSGWVTGAFHGGKKVPEDTIEQKLNFVLSTAPVWDRLELKENKYVLGEFLEFNGKEEDMHALRNIKRSKVSRLTIQKTSMLGFAPTRLQVLYLPRDCRTDGESVSEWNEETVRSSTEVLFQPQNSSKIRKVKLSSLISMSLSV